jgi:hypothetical protein
VEYNNDNKYSIQNNPPSGSVFGVVRVYIVIAMVSGLTLIIVMIVLIQKLMGYQQGLNPDFQVIKK